MHAELARNLKLTMEPMEVKILTFISPHLFYVTSAPDAEQRTKFLQNLSVRIKKSLLGSSPGIEEGTFPKDEMVAVYYKSDLVRASVLEKISGQDNFEDLYYCWLVDYAVLIKTDKVYKLSKEIQKITPRSKLASLNNICYLREHLELGVTGVIKNVPSIVPSEGVIQYSLELISQSDKIILEVAERFNDILIGEVVLHKNGKVLYLTKELCAKGLLTINEYMFQNLKCSTDEYLKTHLKTIHEVCQTAQKPTAQKPTAQKPTANGSEMDNSFVKLSDESKMEESDIVISPPLENGRRRRPILNSPPPDLENHSNIVETAEKEQNDDTVQELDSSGNSSQEIGGSSLSKTARLLQKLEAKKLIEATKKNEQKPGRTDDIWKKVAELKRRRQIASAGSNSEEEANRTMNDSSSITEEETNIEQKSEIEERSEDKATSSVVSNDTEADEDRNEDKTSSAVVSNGTEAAPVSPFASITSQRKEKPKLLLMPAGMERTMSTTVAKKSIPPRRGPRYPKIEKPSEKPPVHKSRQSVPKLSADEDCPTIKISKVSDSLTDDQISAEEVETKTENNKSTSSDSPKPEIFTKQDFCRLVSGCTCVKCRVTLEDDDWDAPLKFGSGENKVAKKSQAANDFIIKPPKLLKTEDQSKETNQKNEILSINYSGMSVMEKKMSCKVLVHGESIPIPIKHVAQVNIHREVYKNISKINYKESKRIQHYAFPAITRNQHIFMVNDAKSGKTLAYLPILMSFVMEKEERYSQLSKMGGGPIVVILCSNSKKCEEIHDLTWMILDKQNRKCSLVTYPKYGNISNVDILITMPTVLSTLISTRATNFKRLCHLVLEDADVMLKSHNSLIRKFFNYADQVLEHRNCPKSIQLILCAQHWTSEMEDLLIKLNKVPMVCIGNHLEASLYGKMKFTMKFLDTGSKEENLQRILQDKFKFTKSVIICNPDELEDVQTCLTLKGIEFTSFLGLTQEEDILYLEAVWNNAQPGKYSVLVCTDNVYNTINVTSAQLLIHFSLPPSWSQFVRRFSCLLENVQTPLNLEKKKLEISSFVFIDENCEPRMSKFSNFIKIAGLEQELPLKIKEFFEGIRLQEEFQRITRNADLCHTLKLFGKCESLYCKHRHILDKAVDSSELLPQNGSIKFKILKMTDAASCSIKLLEHFDLKGHSVRKFEDLTDRIADALASLDSYHPVIKPILSHLYLHKDKDEYFRCKLVEIDDFALVFLIDRGIYCKSDTNRLYKMPENLKKFPPQCCEVHFANLIPPYEDIRFSRLAGRKAQFLVDSSCPDSVMTGTVLLQLGNNLWLDDVCEYLEMHDKSLPSIGFQLTRELVKQEMAIKCSTPLQELYSLCKKAHFELPEYKVTKPIVKKASVGQVQPNWAFLDVNEIHEVTFTFAISPDEFYVRQNKFNKQLLQLEEHIQKQIRKPFYPTAKKIEAGKCYLVKDQVTGEYARGLVLSIEEERAEIFCVDYGDVVNDELTNLKHISDDLILKLPFQSIQCSLHGIKPIDDDWTDAATDVLYTMAFKEDKGTLRSLFIKIGAKQDNPLIKRQNSYLVTLKDGLKRRVLINELLIDCGYAVPNDQEIIDFDLPDIKEESDDDIEEIERTDDDDDDYDRDQFTTNTVEGEQMDFSAFECEILNFDDFVNGIPSQIRQMYGIDAIKDNTPETSGTASGLPAIKAAPTVDYLTPEVCWSQTDTNIKMSIKITDVVRAKMAVHHNRSFQFSTEKGGKKYALNLLLFAKVEKTFQHTILGSQIRVTLKKSKAAHWPRLLHTEEKIRKIYYDVSTIKFLEEEEVGRRPLQLDLSDHSSEEGHDKSPYFVCSDLDSDYDFDIPRDEQ